jgi:hypothetical protein
VRQRFSSARSRAKDANQALSKGTSPRSSCCQLPFGEVEEMEWFIQPRGMEFARSYERIDWKGETTLGFVVNLVV